MPRPLCVKCQVEFHPEKNDIVVEEMSGFFGSLRLWCADLWECPHCHCQIITGYGIDAYAEHWQDGYAIKRQAAEKHGLYKMYEKFQEETNPSPGNHE